MASSRCKRKVLSWQDPLNLKPRLQLTLSQTLQILATSGELDPVYLQDVSFQASTYKGMKFHINYLASHDLYQIDTSNILFIFSGAFVGLENVIRQRMAKGVSVVLQDAFLLKLRSL